MPTNRYALSDYTITVALPNGLTASAAAIASLGLGSTTSIVIGGMGNNDIDGSFVGSIQVQRTKELWTTEGDATGSWVHSKNLDRTGTINVDITQVSDQIIKLVYLCQAYESYQKNVEGLQLEIKNASTGETVVNATDCYINKIPDHSFKDTADKYTFSFTCGRILFY